MNFATPIFAPDALTAELHRAEDLLANAKDLMRRLAAEGHMAEARALLHGDVANFEARVRAARAELDQWANGINALRDSTELPHS